MGRSRSKKPLLNEVKFIDIADGGKAVGKAGERVVFAKGPVPGDVADIQVTKKRKSYWEGFPKGYLSYSSERTEPFCGHFEVCGGCKWQHLDYNAQLNYKEKHAREALRRIAKTGPEEAWLPILGSMQTRNYRNKMEYSFSASRWLTEDEIASGEKIGNQNGLGFHPPGRFDKVVQIETCYLQPPLTNDIRNFVYGYALKEGLDFYNIREHRGLLRNLTLRNNRKGDWMVLLAVGRFEKSIEKLLNEIHQKFNAVISTWYVVNDKKNDSIQDLEPVHFAGERFLTETFPDPKTGEAIKFRIGPKSFFQTNPQQAEQLYKLAYDFAQPKENELVYDLYTGTGTIAQYFARSVKKVIGIEYVEEAIDDAKTTTEINGFENCSFFAGDMKDVLNDPFIEQHGKPDLLITDPPRSGMHPDVVNKLLELLPGRIVYVSCNPATQARDIELLKAGYCLIRSRAVDMFPHTSHVENVTLLKRKDT